MKRDRASTDSGDTLKLSWRVGLGHIETDRAFDALLAQLCRHQGIVDEVALFETITHHLYVPLDVFAQRMDLAARRLLALRQAGIRSVGINVLCTLGHINEAWSYMPPLPFQPMVGHDGSVSTGCACPNTAELRNYVRAKYDLVAKTQPDFVWVDDDIRMQHHGIAWGCFCPTCLKLFAAKAGRSYSRECLVQTFANPAQGHLRQLWIQQNTETISSLLADVAGALHQVDATIATGLMITTPEGATYSGFALEPWFAALKATKARPGGGFYSDETPMQMVRKAVSCGWQRATLPAGVTDIQYELENFPYQLLKKSATALLNECTLALAYGLNGVAFNMLALSHDDFLPLMEHIPAARPLWEQLVEHTAGLPTAGLWTAWTPELMARRTVRQGESWPSHDLRYAIGRPLVLGEIGLPLAADEPGCATVLCGRVAEGFTDERLRSMLAGGLLMDSTTLAVLEERGLAHLTGVRLAERLDNGMMERFTDDPLNGHARGELRDARIEFWGDARGKADVLEPTAPGVRVLTTMEDYFYRSRGPAMSAFENRLGGRIVVMGYAPWIFLHSVGKRLQLQNLADWVSQGDMPLRVDEPVPLVSIVRLSADRRKGAIVLANMGMDAIPEATLHLRVTVSQARWLALGKQECTLNILPEAGGGRISLRDILPWSIHVILLGES